MLTRNFYKLLMVRGDWFVREVSPNITGSNNSYPFVDLINPSGKYICYYGVASEDEDKYQKIDLVQKNFGNNTNVSEQYIIGVTNRATSNSPKASISKSGYTKVMVHSVDKFTSSKDINEQTTTSEACPDGSGSLIMYIGNGTTQPTKDDYTMESCLTAYDRVSLTTTQNCEAGIVMVSYSVRPTEDMHLSEIGIFATKGSYNSAISQAPYKDALMVCHDVFTPVVLPKDKVVTITYTINLSELTAETTIG